LHSHKDEENALKVWKKKWFCHGKVWKTTVRFLYEPCILAACEKEL